MLQLLEITINEEILKALTILLLLHSKLIQITLILKVQQTHIQTQNSILVLGKCILKTSTLDYTEVMTI
jgi:hypothetical protein